MQLNGLKYRRHVAPLHNNMILDIILSVLFVINIVMFLTVLIREPEDEIKIKIFNLINLLALIGWCVALMMVVRILLLRSQI